jgi:hypothetical protein
MFTVPNSAGERSWLTPLQADTAIVKRPDRKQTGWCRLDAFDPTSSHVGSKVEAKTMPCYAAPTHARGWCSTVSNTPPIAKGT